ncbi:hypothetical protein AYO21_11934 [Fonsecaea monophora]|uniref:Uncharacterized protein n=1 Tax=Fonsecaea monophora TaxID=254056 RepID=A0A177EPL9_9EURO|nr:hypothetical protein AYO21_11934 [Fonsecaea monophora]OAG33934.1 hypothetical protein AYO21_11934 [Fonsecaea monophora]
MSSTAPEAYYFATIAAYPYLSQILTDITRKSFPSSFINGGPAPDWKFPTSHELWNILYHCSQSMLEEVTNKVRSVSSAYNAERENTDPEISQQVHEAQNAYSTSKDFPSAEISYIAPKSVVNSSSLPPLSTPQRVPTSRSVPAQLTGSTRRPLTRDIQRSRPNDNLRALTASSTSHVGKKSRPTGREKAKATDQRISGVQRMLKETVEESSATAASPAPAVLDDSFCYNTPSSSPSCLTDDEKIPASSASTLASSMSSDHLDDSIASKDTTPPGNGSTLASSMSSDQFKQSIASTQKSFTLLTLSPTRKTLTMSTTTMTKTNTTTSRRKQQQSTVLKGGPIGGRVKKRELPEKVRAQQAHHSMPLVRQPKIERSETDSRASVSPSIDTLPPSSASGTLLPIEELNHDFSPPLSPVGPHSLDTTFEPPFRTPTDAAPENPGPVSTGRRSIGSVGRITKNAIRHVRGDPSKRAINETAGLSRKLLEQERRRHSFGALNGELPAGTGQGSDTRPGRHSLGALPTRRDIKAEVGKRAGSKPPWLSDYPLHRIATIR